MYIMQNVAKKGWAVQPVKSGKGFVVCDGLSKDDAALLVHYLNGGSVDTSMQMHVMELIKLEPIKK
jgi:xanthine dehydrogenase molybdopterin-binding subunit B